jgi:hypothetical protein
MGWASKYIEKLRDGEMVQFRPRGNSMTGLIKSGQLVTIIAFQSPLEKGDIVLCKVNGCEYLHKIIAIDGERYQIGNNKGKINGWTDRKFIYGLCINIE